MFSNQIAILKFKPKINKTNQPNVYKIDCRDCNFTYIEQKNRIENHKNISINNENFTTLSFYKM